MVMNVIAYSMCLNCILLQVLLHLKHFLKTHCILYYVGYEKRRHFWSEPNLKPVFWPDNVPF